MSSLKAFLEANTVAGNHLQEGSPAQELKQMIANHLNLKYSRYRSCPELNTALKSAGVVEKKTNTIQVLMYTYPGQSERSAMVVKEVAGEPAAKRSRAAAACPQSASSKDVGTSEAVALKEVAGEPAAKRSRAAASCPQSASLKDVASSEAVAATSSGKALLPAGSTGSVTVVSASTVDDVQTLRYSIKHLEDLVKTHEKTVEELRVKYKSEHSQTVSLTLQLQQEIRSKQSLIQKLELPPNQLNKELERAEQRIAALSSKIEALEKGRATWTDQLEDARKRQRTAENIARSYKEGLLGVEVEKLTKENFDLSNEMVAKSALIKRQSEQIEKLKTENDELAEALVSLQDKAEELSDLRVLCEGPMAENTRLRSV
jgi:predicted  nucleic acid-binding Zn-ribbon protein